VEPGCAHPLTYVRGSERGSGSERVPHLAEYAGLWAMDAPVFQLLSESVNAGDIMGHVQAGQQAAQHEDAAAQRAVLRNVVDSVAIIELRGTLMKFVSSFDDGTSTVFAARMIREAARDPAVTAIMLAVDSPGGTVSGTNALALAVAEAAKVKPVHAFVEDLAASAALWVAAQATTVTADEVAKIGSIGVYGVVFDVSEMAAKKGIKVHVVSTGRFKGAGEPGTEITAEQLAEWQRLADGVNDLFIAAVSQGRHLAMDTVRDLADGRVHLAADAQDLGLIDGIGTFDAALAGIRKQNTVGVRMHRLQSADETPASAPILETNMNTQSVKAPAAETTARGEDVTCSAATIQELESAMPDAGSDFVVSCLKQNLTIEQAKDAWMVELRKENDAAKKAAADSAARADAADAKAKEAAGGVQPVTSDGSGGAGGADGGDALEAFDNAVAEKVKGGMKRHDAVAAVVKEDPDRHAAYLEAYNAQHK